MECHESNMSHGLTTVSLSGYHDFNATQTNIQQLLPFTDLLSMALYAFSVSIPICLFGILSNMANIIVFYKMGFSSPSNINLFCLAISDLLVLVYILLNCFGNHPLLPSDNLAISMRDVARIGALSYYSCSAMGSWITAVISVERSFCIAFPLKVKGIFTRKLIISLIGGMIIFQIASGLPRSFGVGLSTVTSPLTNQTRLKYNIFRPVLVTTSIFASFSVPTIVCFVTVIVGTVYLISKFKQSIKVRSEMTGSSKESDKLSDKDVRLVRSVIFICIIYVLGATPNVMIYLVSTMFSALHMDDPYLGNVMTCLLIIGNFSTAISCSVNIFVYLSLGSKYKETFMRTFALGRGLKK